LKATVHYKKEPENERTYQLCVDKRSGKYFDCSTVGDMKCFEAKLVKGTADFMTKIKFNAFYIRRRAG
jgi:hypothetical protein